MIKKTEKLLHYIVEVIEIIIAIITLCAMVYLLFTEVANDLAESVGVEMRTSVMSAEHKVGVSLIGNAAFDNLTIAFAETLVFAERFFVDINFPANAAAVPTGSGNAPKFLIVVRKYFQHPRHHLM